MRGKVAKGICKIARETTTNFSGIQYKNGQYRWRYGVIELAQQVADNTKQVHQPDIVHGLGWGITTDHAENIDDWRKNSKRQGQHLDKNRYESTVDQQCGKVGDIQGTD